MRRFNVQLSRVIPDMPHGHTCPECGEVWLCMDYRLSCNALVKYKRHPHDCWRSDLQTFMASAFSGLPMDAPLSAMFAASVHIDHHVFVRRPTWRDMHGVTLKLTDAERIAVSHPDLQELTFEFGCWRALDDKGTVTHSSDGVRWTGRYGVKHNPSVWMSMPSLWHTQQSTIDVSIGGRVHAARYTHLVCDDVLDADPIATSMVKARQASKRAATQRPKSYSMSGTIKMDNGAIDAFLKAMGER